MAKTIESDLLMEEAARQFHAENPQVMGELIQVSLRVKRAGRKHWSIKAALEVVRYNYTVTTTGLTYKINNNHARFYSRWIMHDVPELAGFYSTREQGRVEQEYFE